MPTVRSEAWSVSLSGFQLLSNISSSSHRPTVKESLHIDISWQSLNCTVTQETEITSNSRHRCPKIFRKCSWLTVFYLCIWLFSLFIQCSARYSCWIYMLNPVGQCGWCVTGGFSPLYSEWEYFVENQVCSLKLLEMLAAYSQLKSCAKNHSVNKTVNMILALIKQIKIYKIIQ